MPRIHLALSLVVVIALFIPIVLGFSEVIISSSSEEKDRSLVQSVNCKASVRSLYYQLFCWLVYLGNNVT